MLFQKSAPHMGRSALAAKAKSKKFWSSSSSQSQQSHPSFFVSTPQFNRRQQTQVVPSFDDSHRGSDSYVENPYLPLTAGASTGTGMTHNLWVDEEGREDNVVVAVPPTQTTPMRHQQIQLNYRAAPPISTQHTQAAHSHHLQPRQSQRKQHQHLSSGEAPEVVTQVIETIDQSESSIIDGVVSKMRRLHASGAHLDVLSAFESVDNTQHNLPMEAYNLMLQSLVETSDTMTLLQAYEGMLSRGAVPNVKTYVIVVNSLVDTAETVFAKRQSLKHVLGSSDSHELESVCEVYEGLAAEEYLLLAQQIVMAVLASRSVVSTNASFLGSVNNLVKACWSCGTEVDENIISTATASHPPELLIGSQPSIHLAASQFSALSPEDQQSEGAQGAMLASYFRFKEPQGAIAFYSGCGAPSYLLKQLLVGFASHGYVATARRWSERNDAPRDAISATLGAIPIENAGSALPSATRLFYQLVGNNGSDGNGESGMSDDPIGNSGRCGYIRLCVAAKHTEALLMAIRESKHSNSSWDASTVSEVTTYLCEKEPLLASDICSWQVTKLQAAHEGQKLKSFVTQEIVSSTVNALKRHNNFSADAALRLLDVVSSCVSSRYEVLKLICTTRLEKPEEVSRLMSSTRALKASTSIAELMLNKTNMLNKEEFALAKQILPAFVRDCIAHKSFFNSDAIVVKETLHEYFPVSPVLKQFDRFIDEQKQFQAINTAPMNATSSALIHRYALAPHGLDLAFNMLKDALMLHENISSSAINSLLQACLTNKANDIVSEIVNLLPRTVENLNLLIKYTAIMRESQMCSECYNELKVRFNVYPTQATYIELFKANVTEHAELMKYFEDAKAAENVELDAESYNYAVQSLARALDNIKLKEVLSEMNNKSFIVSPQSYGSLLNMYIRLDQGGVALELLKKQIPLVTKSLLEVRTFNQLMNYFVHKRPDRTSALEVFVELRNSGTLATPHTYRLLMEAYLLRNNGELPSMQHADRVLCMMKRDGAPITNQCFATLLRARGVIFKDFDGARDFYRGLVKTSRILPDKGIFKALMESYVINGRQKEFGHVIDEMKRYHVPMDDEIRQLVSTK